MSTYADLQARIADELARVDLTSQIALAIQSAIAQYQRTRFFFNDLAYETWSTANNKETYGTADGVPADIVAIDTLTVTFATTRLPVRQREWRYIEERQTGSFKGIPTEYAYYQQQFRFFPIPNQVTTLSLAYHQRVAAPVNGADGGAWVNDAEELIRSSAKRRLYSHVIRDDDDAQLMLAAEADALRVLQNETARRQGTGRIRPTRF